MWAPKISFHPDTVIINDKGSAKVGDKKGWKPDISNNPFLNSHRFDLSHTPSAEIKVDDSQSRQRILLSIERFHSTSRRSYCCPQTIKMAAMFVSQTNPVGFELFLSSLWTLRYWPHEWKRSTWQKRLLSFLKVYATCTIIYSSVKKLIFTYTKYNILKNFRKKCLLKNWVMLESESCFLGNKTDITNS